ncbi:MAG: transporter substrate-binding domain-containing protein [Bacteriovoracaceae bacterium]|nr:transporter substrate-binding domain-containing protein [Bacteriovoracaceae bacterium]
MRLVLTFLLLFSFQSFAQEHKELSDHIEHVRYGGLKRILKDKYLRVLTTKNSFDYYIYQGKPKGIQYEMVREFVKHLNKKYSKGKKNLKIQFEMIPVDYDQMIPLLKKGKGDIIAAGMTINSKRQKKVNFTKPYRMVDEVVVSRKEMVNQKITGKTFHVRKSSSYFESIRKYNRSVKRKWRVKTKSVSEELKTENILELVSLGKYDYTVADSYLAELAAKVFPGLHLHKHKPFGVKQGIAWAVKKEDSKLLQELNTVLPKVRKGSLLGNVFSQKYFGDINTIKSTNFNLGTSHLSDYDKLFKKYAKMYNFDWRLVAALCFQESRFNQGIVNKWGAIGLFQVKQMTANEPYINIKKITGHKNAENNIHAGVKYLDWIRNRYFSKFKKMSDKAKLRMTMAAYNAGPSRVKKAIRLAKKMGLDPNRWFRNVELAMLQMRKPEPVTYVSEINKRYVAYLLLGIN